MWRCLLSFSKLTVADLGDIAHDASPVLGSGGIRLVGNGALVVLHLSQLQRRCRQGWPRRNMIGLSCAR